MYKVTNDQEEMYIIIMKDPHEREQRFSLLLAKRVKLDGSE